MNGERIACRGRLRWALAAVTASAVIGAGPGGEREDCNGNGIEDAEDVASWGTAFDDATTWAAFDPGDEGVGADPDGYWGCVFDGRYVYFVPSDNGTAPHGEVLRYDTEGDYAEAASWATYDPGFHGVGKKPDGYADGVFDGRYIYFAPFRNAGGDHGEVLRYDTQGDFFETASWAAYDPGDHGVGEDPDGYNGAAFDGRYVYFAPYDNGTAHHSEVLRFDTTGDFESVDSWATFDPRDFGVSEKYGYAGALFDGQYVYFVGNCTSDTSHHGEMLRYDTQGDFFDPAAWQAYDPGDCGVGDDPDGYAGAVYDGQYVYFVPCYKEPDFWHCEMLRYDTHMAFDSVKAWKTYNPDGEGIGDNPEGYSGAVFDGRFVYYVPAVSDPGANDEFLRYDTGVGNFQDKAAWTAFRPKMFGVGEEANGFCGAAYDGRHMYFSPMRWANPHGEIMRYDTAAVGSPDCNGNGIPDECEVDDGSAADCNGNGVPDECDIAHGFSWDADGDGVPDECTEECPEDVDGDGVVDVLDLLAVLSSWGDTGGGLPADVNGDGVVDVLDLLAVLGAWGPCG